MNAIASDLLRLACESAASRVHVAQLTRRKFTPQRRVFSEGTLVILSMDTQVCGFRRGGSLGTALPYWGKRGAPSGNGHKTRAAFFFGFLGCAEEFVGVNCIG